MTPAFCHVDAREIGVIAANNTLCECRHGAQVAKRAAWSRNDMLHHFAADVLRLWVQRMQPHMRPHDRIVP